MDNKITWTLYPADAQGILNLLGDVPSKVGIFPLLVDLSEQTKAQMPQPQETPKAA